MTIYKIVAHRDKFGTKPVFTLKNIDGKKLSEIVYALTTEYPGCCISIYPITTYILTKNQNITKQLNRLVSSDILNLDPSDKRAILR